MSGYTVACAICGEPVDATARTTLRRVVGWEEKKGVRVSGAHAGSDIIARQHRDEYAHKLCVTLDRAGIHQGQEQLL